MPEDQEPHRPAQPKPRYRLIVLLVAAVVVAAGLGLYRYFVVSHSPVPHAVQKSASFKIYYPSDSKMPAGYHLDQTSFRQAQPGVILFSVSYSSGRSMVFSEEAQPGGDVISKFVSSAIPINNTLSTPVGKATIGAYGSGKALRTLASLPITNGPWLLVTAPSDINQTDLNNILRSLKK